MVVKYDNSDKESYKVRTKWLFILLSTTPPDSTVVTAGHTLNTLKDLKITMYQFIIQALIRQRKPVNSI